MKKTKKVNIRKRKAERPMPEKEPVLATSVIDDLECIRDTDFHHVHSFTNLISK